MSPLCSDVAVLFQVVSVNYQSRKLQRNEIDASRENRQVRT